MSYRIITCDLDRTLLDSDGKVSERNIEAIRELSRMGVFVVPASGRTMSEMPKVLKDLPEIRYFIYSNGAAALDRYTGKKALACIEKPTAQEVFKILKSYEAHITFRYEGECFVDSRFQTDEHFKYYDICPEHVGVVKDFARHIDNFDDMILSLDNVEVFSAFFHDLDERVECGKKLEELGVDVVFTFTSNIEMFSKRAGKGNALKNLCAMTGIDPSDTIAVGDGNNDSSMVETAGLGLAVSNAVDELKTVADEVICSNNEHIIEYILKKYF